MHPATRTWEPSLRPSSNRVRQSGPGEQLVTSNQKKSWHCVSEGPEYKMYKPDYREKIGKT